MTSDPPGGRSSQSAPTATTGPAGSADACASLNTEAIGWGMPAKRTRVRALNSSALQGANRLDHATQGRLMLVSVATMPDTCGVAHLGSHAHRPACVRHGSARLRLPVGWPCCHRGRCWLSAAHLASSPAHHRHYEGNLGNDWHCMWLSNICTSLVHDHTGPCATANGILAAARDAAIFGTC